jgi:DNA topoisomerase III
MYIVNIAEKPSVAKSISKILSQSISTQRGKHKYCPNITFSYKNDTFIFTSVLGHVYNLNFIKKYSWEQIDPKILFYEPLVKNISDDFINLRKNIEEQVMKADKAIIWTDCDREGEHIALQISNIIKDKKKIIIKRARFSGISRTEIENALENLVDINIKEADAVDCRMEMDLRIGSSFTILQTLAIKELFNSKKIISFGPCQIPTLGFVVERYLQISNFKEENMYSLELIIDEDKWTWKRANLFDKNCVAYFYNSLCRLTPSVVKKEVKSVVKMKPLPLRTVELQKLCSSIYKISSHKVMEISESLYNKGYISYPRTETDAFSANFNFNTILNKLSSDNSFSEIAQNISKNLKLPRSGRNNDLAHSPIYPLKHGNDLSGIDRSIYEFVARRFLGSLCEDAKGIETYYELMIGRECFYIKGLEITEKNYLNVYTYDKWNNKQINEYILNKKIGSFELNLVNGKTSPPFISYRK